MPSSFNADGAQKHLNSKPELQGKSSEVIQALEQANPGRSDFEGEFSVEGTDEVYDEEGEMIPAEELEAHRFYQEAIALGDGEELVETFIAYEEAETISEATESLGSTPPTVAQNTLDFLYDELGVVDVDAGDVEYTAKGEAVRQGMDYII